ncbi:MAG: asparagine synthetase B [Planctomycetes bacterium]|nr:asparagine synthetase B [Planctomycetota bacterium]
MCGIVGVRDDWLRRRGLDPALAMRRAVDRLSWRGPDGRGHVRHGDWWLGCARLAITQPGSSQPVVRRGGRLAAVLNGAITNARELWAELLPAALRRRAPPNDAWLPLLAVERDRRDLLARLRGHHAFAVVDRDSGELVHGRDRYGEKPLFMLVDGPDDAVLAFASSLPALRALGMPRPAAGARLWQLVRFGFAVPAPRTLDDGLRLMAAPRGASAAATPTARGASATANLRQRLIASVDRCSDTTVAAGLFLSGGIDSSCLAAALRAIDRPLPAFQFRADGAAGVERELAVAVAAHCRLPFHPVDGGPGVLDALPRLTLHAGMPLGDPSILAVHAVARAAAATGIKVMLGGEGADELFFGYRRYAALRRLPRLPWLRRTASRWGTGYFARWWRAVTGDDPIAALLAVTPPAFAATVLAGSPDELDEDRSPYAGATPGHSLSRRARDADLDGYLRHDLLPKVDIATMAAGVEARCPYLEGEPDPTATVASDLGKRRLRAAFEGDLPARVFRQRKRGFSLPLDRWFRGDLPLLDLLRDRRTLDRPHLDAGGVGAAIDRHRRGGCDLGHGLYLLAAYEVFLRSQEQHDRESGDP